VLTYRRRSPRSSRWRSSSARSGARVSRRKASSSRSGPPLKEAQAALERECSAREEAQGQLQQEHTALEEARATLKLRDAEIVWLIEELVQEVVSFEELCNAGEEKYATILELQQAAETAHAALETEKKQVKGKFPLSILLLFLGFVEIRSQLVCFFLLSGLQTALGMSTTQVEALQVAYNSSQQELEALQEAALEACQSVDEGPDKQEALWQVASGL
jgi:DNA repair exonuclease SbcCD ATPase subunit